MITKNAIFLDRDGTLNKGVIKDDLDSFKLRPPYKLEELYIYKDLSYLKSFSGKYHLFIITNQPDIKRGYQTEEFNNFINSSILKEIDVKKIYNINLRDIITIILFTILTFYILEFILNQNHHHQVQ